MQTRSDRLVVCTWENKVDRIGNNSVPVSETKICKMSSGRGDDTPYHVIFFQYLISSFIDGHNLKVSFDVLFAVKLFIIV